MILLTHLNKLLVHVVHICNRYVLYNDIHYMYFFLATGRYPNFSQQKFTTVQ